jgi:hypothetical protein
LFVAVLAGWVLSLTLSSAALVVEFAYIQPHIEQEQLRRRDERVHEAIEAQVGQDEFWKATLWDLPSGRRQVAILVLIVGLPVTLGAAVAGWVARRRPLWAAALVIGAYGIIPLTSLFRIGDDDGPDPPIRDLATMSPWLFLAAMVGLLLLAPLVAALVAARVSGTRPLAGTGRAGSRPAGG